MSVLDGRNKCDPPNESTPFVAASIILDVQNQPVQEPTRKNRKDYVDEPRGSINFGWRYNYEIFRDHETDSYGGNQFAVGHANICRVDCSRSACGWRDASRQDGLYGRNKYDVDGDWQQCTCCGIEFTNGNLHTIWSHFDL